MGIIRTMSHGAGDPSVTTKSDPSVATKSGRYIVEIVRNMRIPIAGSDITLAADLYMPRCFEQVPALVTLHTARRDSMAGMSVRRYFRYFAERGFACLLVDSRGTGDSDGSCHLLLEPGEAEDGVTVVEWVAQQPWCTGRVGMWGLSIGATNSLATASRRPPHLKAIMPVMGLLDARQHMVRPSGSPSAMGFAGRICLHDILFQLLPPLSTDESGDLDARWRKRVERFDPWIEDWLTSEHSGSWLERRTDPSKIEVPSFFVTGWRDYCADAMIHAYEAVRGPKKLLSGPWLHAFPEASPIERVNLSALAYEWWDRWLRAESPSDAVDEEPVTVYIQGRASQWAAITAWPPVAHTELEFALTQCHGLAEVVPGSSRRGAGHVRPRAVAVLDHVSDPTVGALAGLWTQPTSKIGYPLDQHEDDARSMTFTSDHLLESMTIAGSPTCTLALDQSSTATRCIAKMADVDLDDRSTVITTGLVNLDTFHSSAEGSRKTVGVTFAPTCYEIAKGHRLRVTLSESDFPRLWPAAGPNTLRIHVAQGSPRELVTIQGPCTTTVRMPVVSREALRETNVPLVEQHRIGTVRASFSEPAWTVTRDYCKDVVTVEVDQTEGGSYLEGAHQMLQLHRVLAATVNGIDGSAQLSANGTCVVEGKSGEEIVVEAFIEARDDSYIAHGSVTVDGQHIASRNWSSKRGQKSVPDE